MNIIYAYICMRICIVSNCVVVAGPLSLRAHVYACMHACMHMWIRKLDFICVKVVPL